MAYTKTNWTNSTPINTKNLNNIENGIEQNYKDIEATKHTHTNKTILDSITQENIYNWNNPDIPTKVSELENDSNFATESYVDEKVGSSGGSSTYELPIASADTLGGIKVGANLSIDADGVLSASGGSSENGGSASNIYSTEEQHVGTWIDGKPLYRLVIIAEKKSGSNLIVPLTNFNIKEFATVEGSLQTVSGLTYALNRYESSAIYSYFACNLDSFRVVSSNGEYSNGTVRAVIQYTKTTD